MALAAPDDAPAPAAARRGASDDGASPLPPAARRAVRRTLWALWAETLIQRFWAAGVALAALAALLGWDSATLLSPAARRVAVALAAAGLALLVARGLWRGGWPDAAQARARVDAALPGAPLAGLADRIALNDSDRAGRALWAAHRADLRRRAAAARAVRPAPGLARRDPFGLRLIALTALAMAALFGPPGATLRGLRALIAPAPVAPAAVAAATGPAWEGWARPPAYTGRATVYLTRLDPDAVLDLPAGTEVTLRLYGPDRPEMAQDIGPPTPGAPPEAPGFVARHSGTLRVAGESQPVRVIPDTPPEVAAGAPAVRRADGQMVQPVSLRDDHGVTRAVARVELDLAALDRRHGLAPAPEPRAPLILPVTLPPGAGTSATAAALRTDLARDLWANLPVRVTFEAEDGAGQTARAVPLALILPGRGFFDPVAAALVELRRDLLWSAENAPRVAALARALRWVPEDAPEDALPPAADAVLTEVIAALEAGPVDAGLRARLGDALWTAAVAIEEGGLADALARMRQAQARLAEAIRKGASPEEMRRLTEALRAATDAYTDLLADRPEDPAAKFDRSPKGAAQRLTGDQIDAMMAEIERLMAEGRQAEAQALLDQFNRMMENLTVTREAGGEGGTGAARGRSAQALRDSLRAQQELADEALRQAQDAPWGEGSESGSGSGAGSAEGGAAGGAEGGGAGGAEGGGAGGDLAARQRALRDDLARQRALAPPGRGGEPADSGTGAGEGEDALGRRLDEAGAAMERAEQALREGDPAAALSDQAAAIGAMREGLRALARQAEGAAGSAGAGRGGPEGQAPGADGQGGAQPGQGGFAGGGPRLDPLGRDVSGQGGGIVSGEGLAEGGADPSRTARDLRDEIRRRSGQGERPETERDYLRRLLDEE